MSTIRVSPDHLKRADDLTEPMERDPAIRALVGGKLSRSAVLRLALHRGLKSLEREHHAKEEDDTDK